MSIDQRFPNDKFNAPGLKDDEIRFYDALADNESVMRELSDETLKKIAHELTKRLRQILSMDWFGCENIRAKLRLMVKRSLRKYKFCPIRRRQLWDWYCG